MADPQAERSVNAHRELGKVAWYRDYAFALAESRRTGKPVLLQFQEVPGCATCVNFGREVLSHPLMVEVIEEAFVPLAIFNNRAGRDAQVLEQFGEPSWNNPVTYFLTVTAISSSENWRIITIRLRCTVNWPKYCYARKAPCRLTLNYSKVICWSRTDTRLSCTLKPPASGPAKPRWPNIRR